MTCINLTPDEARAFPSTILRILPEQPPPEYELGHISETYKTVDFRRVILKGEPVVPFSIKPPFKVGDVVGCKETFIDYTVQLSLDVWSKTKYAYKSDGHSSFDALSEHLGCVEDCSQHNIQFGNNNKWRSSATMPKSAIRKWLKIENVDVKRVQEIDTITMNRILPNWYTTSHELKAIFINHFNSLYAKLQPVKKAGKIVSYVVYPYDEFTIEEEIHMGIVMRYDSKGNYLGRYYKGLPLIIHANPYIMLIDGKEIKP